MTTATAPPTKAPTKRTPDRSYGHVTGAIAHIIESRGARGALRSGRDADGPGGIRAAGHLETLLLNDRPAHRSAVYLVASLMASRPDLLASNRPFGTAAGAARGRGGGAASKTLMKSMLRMAHDPRSLVRSGSPAKTNLRRLIKVIPADGGLDWAGLLSDLEAPQRDGQNRPLTWLRQYVRESGRDNAGGQDPSTELDPAADGADEGAGVVEPEPVALD